MLFLILLKMDNMLVFSYLKTTTKCGLHPIFNNPMYSNNNEDLKGIAA